MRLRTSTETGLRFHDSLDVELLKGYFRVVFIVWCHVICFLSFLSVYKICGMKIKKKKISYK